MENKKRLIDANTIPYEEHYVPDGDVQWEYKKELCVLKPTIDAMPTVDAVEVVRCKACEHYVETKAENVVYCKKYNRFKKADDFCSYGERKDK